MSCSKLFSEDLSTYNIIKYFRNDFSTLHSCILVNRLWCRLTIPLLWENPFSRSNTKFIDIYLRNFNNEYETKLDEYKIKVNPLPPNTQNTLFNYPGFLKHLNISKVIFTVDNWFIRYRAEQSGNKYFLQDLDYDSANDFKNLIKTSLFRMFIKNEVNLHTLEIEISSIYKREYYYNTCFNNILELILQNPNFIHNIKDLKLYTCSSSDFEYHKSGDECDERTLIKDRITQIIDLHRNLRKILLSFGNLSLYQSLLVSKDSNCSNTLNTILFYRVNFKSIINLDKAFEQLNVLKSVHIIYCSLDTGFIQQIINLTKPFKLKSLFLEMNLQIDDSLHLFLQKTGDHLENFRSRFGYNQKFLELIMKYCKNIKFLNLYKIDNQFTHLITNLTENIKQNLNYLTIEVLNSFSDEASPILLQNLGQTLPSKLEYLSLKLCIKTNDFVTFLKNSQNTFIEKLLIMQEGNENILQCIKKYIMEEGRVKYLAFKNEFNKYSHELHELDSDLHNSKDEVKEFKSHNIIVKNHEDLCIKIYDFIREID